MFQCPRGLELLRMISTLRSGVWRFNALTGLSCYGWGIKSSRSGCRNCFNALTGLSCYGPSIALLPSFTLFQCPHGLELLPITRLISSRQIMFQCPLGLELLHGTDSCCTCTCSAFQCPLGLELLQQECPIFNQLSEFLRCESPSTFLGTYLSHHSFIWW